MLRSAEPQPRAPEQQRSRDKRTRLLAAGRRIFGRYGYEGASIGAIAARAGTAAGGFYQHFASKRQFLIVLMNELLDRLASLDPPRGDAANPRQGLHEFLTAAFRTDADYYGVVRAWQEAALSDPELARMERRIEAWTRGRVLGMLERLAHQAGTHRHGDLRAFARMLDRHFWSLLARGPRLSAAELDREIALATDVIWSYLRMRSDQRQ